MVREMYSGLTKEGPCMGGACTLLRFGGGEPIFDSGSSFLQDSSIIVIVILLESHKLILFFVTGVKCVDEGRSSVS